VLLLLPLHGALQAERHSCSLACPAARTVEPQFACGFKCMARSSSSKPPTQLEALLLVLLALLHRQWSVVTAIQPTTVRFCSN